MRVSCARAGEARKKSARRAPTRPSSTPTSRAPRARSAGRKRIASSATQIGTDAFTTALFHEVYLGEPTHSFEDLVGRPYDLFLVCGLDVPWRHDGLREFEEQRRWMHERYLEHVRESSAPWRLLEGTREERLAESRVIVDGLLGERPRS